VEPGSPVGALAGSPLSHSGPGEKEAPTVTQSESKTSTKRFLVPPLSLTFCISQEHKNRCVIDALGYSGNHCFVHRQLEAFYDTFGEIPVMIGSSMLSWTLWLVQFEAERRDPDQSRRLAPLSRFPDWPSPDRKAQDLDDVEF
jgi:hypothetical protein